MWATLPLLVFASDFGYVRATVIQPEQVIVADISVSARNDRCSKQRTLESPVIEKQSHAV